MIKRKIFIVDDEEEILNLLTDVLEKNGFLVLTAKNTEDGYKGIIKSKPDLVILDLVVPNIGGVELCRLLREDHRSSHIPIIMLTVQNSEPAKVMGLTLGADDYITKPFSAKELVARINSLLRRTYEYKEKPKVLEYDALRINIQNRTVHINETLINLTPKEFDLLVLLAENPNVVVRRNIILENIFGYKHPIKTRTIDTHIRQLRKKLGKFGKKIKTVYEYGYKFVTENEK